MASLAARVTRIVVFAKQPVPGRVKTRLIPALGAEGAAALAKRMLEWTLREALATEMEVELCGDPDPAGWHEGREVALTCQGPGDLGERLGRAAERVLADQPVMLIGTDCPVLGRARLKAAAGRLPAHDAVIHRTEDGGYALLGLNRFHASIFDRIAWSSDAVASETVRRIERLGWSLHVGETLHDVDEPGDLPLRFRQ